MRTQISRYALAFVAGAALLAAPVVEASNNPPNPNPVPQNVISQNVRHALVSLSRLTVFDDLSYRVDGSTVTLFGEVTWPIVKSDAEGAVKHIEGVTSIDNQIEVLPLSPMDNAIRFREARAIFGYPELQRYGMGALPSIRIIVKNGHVTLKGIVTSDMDRQLAYMRANGVPQVFSVTNDLQVQKD